MPKFVGPTCYILGAGASAHTGTPLLADFLVSARHHMHSSERKGHLQSFEVFFEWLDRMRATAYYVDFNLDNLEHVFSVLEMQKQLGIKPAAELVTHLLDVIAATLDQVSLPWGEGGWTPDPTY